MLTEERIAEIRSMADLEVAVNGPSDVADSVRELADEVERLRKVIDDASDECNIEAMHKILVEAMRP